MRTSRRTLLGRDRAARLALEYLEDRSVPAAALFFDPILGDLSILGTDQNDRFTLAADLDGDILVTHNGKPLQALDPATNQPAQVGPTVWNTDSIQAVLGAGDDVFDLFGDRLEQVGVGKAGSPIEILGEAGNDVLTVRAAADITGPECAVGFDGGDGSADQFRLLATDADEALDAVSMNDFHDIALRDVGSVMQKVRAEVLGTERLFFDMAGGDDAISARVEAAGIIGPTDYRFDLGMGDDVLDLVGIVMPDAQPDGSVGFHVSAGAGDDLVQFDFSEMGHTPVRLDIAAGFGDDRVAVIMPCNSDVGIDLGFGDDVLELSGQVETGRISVRAGPGDDQISARVEEAGIVMPNASFDLGAGDDVLNVDFRGSVRLSVFGGAGADVVDLVGIIGPTDNHWDIFASLGTHDDLFSFHWQPDDPMAQTGSLDMRLRVLGGSGADVVDLAGVIGLTDSRVDIFANLGAGGDEFGFDLSAAGAASYQPQPAYHPHKMRLNVLGGTGSDVVDVVGTLPPYNADVGISINLGSGADTAVVGLTSPDSLPNPQLTPTLLNMVLNGSSGNDAIEVWLDLPLRIAMKGRVRVLGSAGNDDLAIFADGNTSALDLLIDGGLGRDTAEKRGKVRVLSC